MTQENLYEVSLREYELQRILFRQILQLIYEMNESVAILLVLCLSIVINQRPKAVNNILPQVPLLEYHECNLINRQYLHTYLRHRVSILSPLPANN